MRPDEKTCPYCAEVIKAAAVRCRYCQADLGPAPAPEPAPAPAPGPAPEPAPKPDLRSPWLRSRSRKATRILAGALVGMLVLAAVVALTNGREPAVPTSGEDAVAVQLRDRTARDAALQAATRLTQQVLSYKWNTIEADIRKARAGMTPGFEKEYLEAMDSVRDQTREKQIELKASVVAAGVVSATESRFEALLFTNQTTLAKGSNAPRIDQNRVVVTLVRDAGDWRVSKMDAF